MSPASPEIPTLRVADFVRLINDTFVRAFPAHVLQVEGEVSDARTSQQKWISFDLKDTEEPVILKCFATVWTPNAPLLTSGLKIRVRGVPKVYERYGNLTFTIETIELMGEGALQQAYEALKKRLQQEGLFDASRKRALPRLPGRVGLITSRDAAAYGDFLRVLKGRFADIEVVHAHVAVQGASAVEHILQAISDFQALPARLRPEVLVITRGGGGLEDLHAFNDERVARAVFACSIPVVSAIGHERDECLIDFVADVRAATPSHAAQTVVPDRAELTGELNTLLQFLDQKIDDQVRQTRDLIARVRQGGEVISERSSYRLDRVLLAVDRLVRERITKTTHRLDRIEERVTRASPTHILARGYTLIRQDGVLVKTGPQLDTHQPFQIQFAEAVIDIPPSAHQAALL